MLRRMAAGMIVVVMLVTSAWGARAPRSAKVRVTRIAAPVMGFDFGPAKGPVWPGFRKVTPATAFKGGAKYGWDKPATWFYTVDYRRYDPLTQDYCRPARGDATFFVALPNGRYLVTIVYGDGGQFPGLFPFVMKLQGEKVIDWTGTVAEYYRHSGLGWWPGESAWKYQADVHRFETFPVVVRDGKLAVWMRRYFFLCGILIAPAEQEARLKATLATIQRDRRRAFETTWPEGKPLKAIADKLAPRSFAPSASDRARGYTLFARFFDRPAYPDSRPAPRELRAAVDLAAAQGEAEPGTVCFVPYKDFAGAAIRVTDLKGPDGATLPATAFRVYRVRYKETVYGSRSVNWFAFPRMLDAVEMKPDDGGARGTLDGKLRPYPKGCLTRVWLTLETPADARPGDYRGEVALTPQGAAEGKVAVRVKVHPFQLREPTEISFAMCHSPAYGLPHRNVLVNGGRLDMHWPFVERDLAFLRKIGCSGIFTAFVPKAKWKGDKPSLDFSDFNRMLALLNKHHLDRLVLNFGTSGAAYAAYLRGKRGAMSYLDPKTMKLDARYLRRVTAYCRELKKEQDRAGWPPVYFNTIDETSNWREKGWASEEQVARAMKAGGVRTFQTANGRGQLRFLDVIDMTIPNFAVPLKKATFDMLRAAKTPYGFYNIGWDRFTWGIYCWRAAAVARMQWHFRTARGDPFSDFDRSDAATIAYATPDRLIPTPFSERVREGIQDGWYLYMLEDEIRRAPAGSAAARAAAAYVAGLRKRIPDEFSRFFTRAQRYDPEPGDRTPYSITPEEMAALRLEVAKHIAALKTAGEGR